MARFSLVAALFFILATLTNCATYSSRISEPRRLFEYGQFDMAIEDLKKLVERNDNDLLLYLMDLGLIYHSTGQYKLAVETFRKADKLAEIKDYTSITAEAASIILSDEVKSYKGEDFEKILVNVYLAMGYTMLHQWDDALVECRRVNHKLDKMISEGKLPYHQNAFAKYLAATLFEARHEYNDAFVDYRQILKWYKNLEFPYLGMSLLRMSDKLKASQEFDDYKKKFKGVDSFRLDKGHGEIVVLIEQGKAPIKEPHPNFRLLPKFYKNTYISDHVNVRNAAGTFKERSYTLYDIEETAIRELDYRVELIIAKKITGMVVKEAVAYGVERATESPLLGFLTSAVLHSTDSADLRSWTTLPAHLQIARVTVPAGRHDILLDMVTSNGTENPGVKKWDGVEVKSGETVFLNHRLLD